MWDMNIELLTQIQIFHCLPSLETNEGKKFKLKRKIFCNKNGRKEKTEYCQNGFPKT